MNRVFPRYCMQLASFLCLIALSVAIVAQENSPAVQGAKSPASPAAQATTTTTVLSAASDSATGVQTDPGSDSSSDTSSAPEPAAIYKGNSTNGFALEPRLGVVLWEGQSYPTNLTATSGIPDSGSNGIRGSYLFNGPNIPTIGFGTRMHIDGNWRFSPSVDFIFDEYVYRPDLKRAFPTQNMTGNDIGPVALVMGILINAPLWYDIRITNRLSVGLAPGLAFYPKIAISAIDGSTGISAIGTFLNQEGRWFYPETAFSLRYAITPWLNAAIELQILYPIWHIWISNPTPFYDGMMVNSLVGFDFYL